MRVHLVHQAFDDYVTGLRRGLSEAVALSTSAISQKQPNTADQWIQVPRFRSPLAPFRSWKAVRSVLDVGADVIHWQAAGNPWVDASFALSTWQRPVVVTVHDMTPHPGDDTVLPGTFAAIARIARRAERVIVHSEAVAEQARRIGIQDSRLRVIPHGELGSVYTQDPAALVPQIAGPQVLFFGRLQGYKGVDVLLEAMRTVVTEVPDARLLIAGSGKASSDTTASLADPPRWLDLELGFVSNERVVEIFRDSAVVALPYKEASQSGVAALASGLGRPVAASAVGGLTEIVLHERTGLLVRPGDPAELAVALIRLLQDAELRTRLSIGALEHARTALSWRRIAEDTVAVYEEATRAHRR